MREWGRKNPLKVKNNDLKRNFGITLDEYNDRLARQGGLCAICRNAETVIDNRTQRPRSLAVDHCHVTDEVRGLLCTGCNQGIGNFRDDPDRLLAAIQYLTEARLNKQRREGEGAAPTTIPPIPSDMHRSVPGTGFGKTEKSKR